MLTAPNKGQSVVDGCACPGDMAVRMRNVLPIPLSLVVFWVC